MLEENKQLKIWLNILLAAFYFLVFATLLHNSFSYLDPDFGWHMKTGELIWQTRAVPDLNLNDYTLAGTHWVDHEWLANIFIYLIYHNFGYIALSVFFALIVLAALIIQLQFTRKYFLPNDRGLILVLALQLAGLYASLPHLGIRIQEITVLFLLLLGIIIFLYNKNKNYKILFWLIPLFIIWASAHGGFLIGLAVLGIFIFIKALELLSAKKFPLSFLDYSRVLSNKEIGIFAGFSVLATVSTLATPYDWRLYGFLFTYGGSYYQTHLAEWQGQYFYPLVYPQLAYLEILLVFLALVLISAFIAKANRRRIDLYDFILTAVFVVLAIRARRHFPLLFIISLPIMAKFFMDFYFANFSAKKAKAPEIKSAGNRAARLNNLINIFLAVVIIFSGALIALKINFTAHPETAYQKGYPYQAAVFLRAHPEWNSLKIFNEYAWGGYLLWQNPGRQLFLDGRLPQYPLAGQTALQESEDFFVADKMLAQLQKYDIGLVLIDSREDYPKLNWLDKLLLGASQEQLNKNIKDGFALLDYLRAAPAWRSVYRDNTAEIFVKK